ncbi:MAG: Outer membrane protein assembly factor BamE [uncultured Thiotrichaceae bacterium]|uniref:Outer membrane protein assembly factor BamE n=1 Tax=uncultured Thiotrichaceae bacterium TaxID=298394 RepID=A0A6S6SZL8_9GAMM|nr:MAG: Outer membrane protein assembly factor BamE [uncultured Thiotrichaceae bacterium]
MIIRLISVFVLSTALLSGCSIYKMDIQQGNYITQEAISQLKPGMNRSEVQEVLGTPLLTDDFRQNRWDYVFYIEEKGQVSKKSSLAVFFNDQGIVSDIRQD